MKKILIIRLSSVGDILLTTPVLRALRREFPKAQIDFTIKAKYIPLIAHHPAVHRVYAFDATSGFEALRTLKKELRQQRYDLVIDLHKNFRSIYLRYGLGAKQILKYRKDVWHRFLLVTFKINRYTRKVSVAQRYLEALHPLGITDKDSVTLDLFLDSEIERRVIERLRAEGFDDTKPSVALVPGAGFATKRWLPERFAAVADHLIDHLEANVVILGGVEDVAIGQAIRSAMRHEVMDLCGQLSLAESACAVNQTQAVITNDTGLMHVAVALKKGVVALFGPTVEAFGFFPYGTEHVVIQRDLACRPCSHLGSEQCPRGHFRCMRDIQADEVYNAAVGLLRRRARTVGRAMAAAVS